MSEPLQIGDLVLAYKDPLTRCFPFGKVELLTFCYYYIDRSTGLEVWIVDNEGKVVKQMVHPDDKLLVSASTISAYERGLEGVELEAGTPEPYGESA